MLKKEMEVKSVHRFTDTATMKFRPIHFNLPKQQPPQNTSVVDKVSQILGSFFGKTKPPPSNQQHESKNKTYSKSAIVESPGKNRSMIQGKGRGSVVVESGQEEIKTIRKMQTREQAGEGENSLCYLQKITTDTFLIGNQHQLDLITISGIYDNAIDTEINWSFNLQKRLSKLSVDTKKCLMAVQVEGEVAVYRYDSKRLKTEPVHMGSTRLLGEARFLVFLKDSQFAVCYESSACVYQIEESNCIRLIFNKRYGVSEHMRLFQVPRPVENVLNIFFVEKSTTSKIYVLWRLQLELKAISSSHGFKSIVRIYDIPAGLVNKFKIDNFSKDVIILNFKFEILAAKDGFIIDAANTNIQEDGSCLVYQGEHLLHISDDKLFIYGFRILTGVKPNKIELRSLDSIEIKKDARFGFFDCLEMLNGNFVLFFQVKPECNNKLRGEIDYLVTVTQKLSVQEKLNEIFAFRSPQELKEMTENDLARIQEKCDMAFKIGLNRKQVYLELWNKSNKREIADYKFLLDTMDYDTIKEQIEKKLKKASMPFNEVFKIEQACFEMLRADLFSNSNCGEKAIKNYLISHFLLRKLTYFRNNNLSNPACTRPLPDDTGRAFYIDIQQYVQTIKLELKSHFLEYVSHICFDGKQEVENLRIFLRDFRFPLRIMYQQLLETLIVHTRSKLIAFLKAIPEMLPFDSDGEGGDGNERLQGLWSGIDAEEWQKNLHIQEISTIYNKDYVQELTKTVWFKRNQNSLHDLVALSKQKIKEVQQFNQSDAAFYFFIEKLFQHSRNEKQLGEVVDYLETNYTRLPAHLKGKIFLYRHLWTYFQAEKHPQLTSFNSFLKLRDHELFKELFRYEKVKKGCLLKDAKHIYEDAPNGIELYHEGLLNYFASDLSQISDLKYILNRLNNEKREFHIENEGIYVVLVRAMQMKLKLGSDNDIPLDEVMIYIENIPLSKNNNVIEDLKTVERINEESDRFKKMKLNMSLLEIIENCEDVITALINEEIRENNVLALTDRQALVNASYGILAEVQTIKDKIYKGKYSDLPYFIYLSKLLENQRLVPDVAMLLTDPFLLEYYCVDERLVENLVLYMYKWKFNQEATFVKNKDYLEALLGLLPEESECRRYIEAEIEFALMLSTPNYPIEYPLTQSETLSIEEISAIVGQLSGEEVAALDVERLHGVVLRMQELCVDMEVTSLPEIYEVCIIRLISLNGVREAIPMIRKLIDIHGTNENYAVVFCFLIVSAILNEMPDVHRKGLLRIAFYTFTRPLLLLDVVERRLQAKLSNEEEQAFLAAELEGVRGDGCCFRADNQLLDEQIRGRVAQNKEKYYHKVEELVFHTWAHLSSNREDFERSHDYSFYYIMLLHNPYAVAKYLCLCPEQVNIRLLRSYISYVFKEDIFHGNNVLLHGRRIFLVALEATLTLLPVEVVASQFKGNDPQADEDQLDLDLSDAPIDPASFPAKLRKSIETFNRKIASFKGPKEDEVVRKKRRVEALLSSQASIQDNDASEYPFNDSDDNYEDLQEAEQQQQHRRQAVHVQHRKKHDWHFDANRERRLIMEREGKNLALHLSSAGVVDDDIRRTSPHMLKSAKTFHHAFQSVKLSGSSNLRKSSQHMGQGALDSIERSDSLALKEEDHVFNREEDMAASLSQEDLFKSAQPILFRPMNSQQGMYNTYSPEHSPLVDSLNSPMKLASKDSVVAMELEEEEAYDSGWRVQVREIDDEQYTSVESLKKQLLADAEGDTVFDLSLIAKEEERELGDFEEYLRELIVCVYNDRSSPLSLLLQLIKQIRTAYPGAGVSNEFLEYYVSLESYNQKYKSEYLLREMFPAEALFLPSKDPLELFKAVKQHILEVASYDRIVVIAQLLTAVLRKPEIKDDLYLSYLAREIELYGNDSSSSELELKMQRERIEGMLPQITTSTLLLERAEIILRPIASSAHAPAVAEMIREALRKKKKDYLIREFDKKIAPLGIA